MATQGHSEWWMQVNAPKTFDEKSTLDYGYGLVLPGNKPLPEPVWIKTYDGI